MKVRVKAKYVFNPCGWDICDPPYGVQAGILKAGDIVQVTNLPGCPRAGTMGHCHVQNPETKQFLGLVQVNSLDPINAKAN